MCARRLSIRRAGPERASKKNTSCGSAGSFTSSVLPAARPLKTKRVPPCPGRGQTPTLTRAVWEIYRIGVCAGGGVAVGLAVAAIAARFGPEIVAVVAAVIAAVVAGVAVDWIGEAIGAAAGGLLGGAGAAVVAGGTLRRGGTAGGTAVLLLVAAVGALALAFVPLAGYLEAAALPALASRTRRRAGEKYAGLRSLAK